MKLRAAEMDDLQQVRQWRNCSLETLRTPMPLTWDQQEDFYLNEICNKDSHHRYWVFAESTWTAVPVAFGGITNIQWENRIGEISLILDPSKRGEGLGTKAAHLLLDQAFNYLNLDTVFGECYGNNKTGLSFWEAITKKYGGATTSLPRRKYWSGKTHDSLYFTITREGYNQSGSAPNPAV